MSCGWCWERGVAFTHSHCPLAFNSDRRLDPDERVDEPRVAFRSVRFILPGIQIDEITAVRSGCGQVWQQRLVRLSFIGREAAVNDQEAINQDNTLTNRKIVIPAR